MTCPFCGTAVDPPPEGEDQVGCEGCGAIYDIYQGWMPGEEDVPKWTDDASYIAYQAQS